jgi:hypothetical protein
MKKLNTHSVYEFALRIHPLTTLEYKDGMTLKDIFLPVVRAEISLRGQLEVQSGFFSPSLKRKAGAVLRAMYDLGLDSEEAINSDLGQIVEAYRVSSLTQRVKEFETVLANELPGLATYVVSQKGIYSTDELISHAEMHVPEKCRVLLNEKATEDIQQAGKCLAFEVATASAFHMWRAVESVMDSYYQTLMGKTFSDAGVTRNWGQYIQALQNAKAETKITTFLDHIREEYRNPISHPDESLELDEAFQLFGAAMSAIGQILKAILEIKEKEEADRAAKATLPEELPSIDTPFSLGALAGLSGAAKAGS